MHLDIKMA